MPRPPKHVVLSKKEIGERLRAIRLERRITQVEFAKMLGTHQPILSRIELGLRGVSLQQVVKLARTLRVSPDRLIGVSKSNGHEAPVRNERLMKRVRRIELMRSEQQEAAIKVLDGFLDAHGL